MYIDASKLETWLKYVAWGLSNFHWEVVFDLEAFDVNFVSPAGPRKLDQLFSMRAA